MDGPQGLNCVKGEIHNVLSVLRLGMRLAAESSGFYGFSFASEPLFKGSPDKELIRSFKQLYDQLGFYSDLSDVDTRVFLRPFLETVESAFANASVTRAALHSVHKFLLYGLITPNSHGAAEAVGRIASCTINFQFKKHTIGGSSGDSEEILLMKVMEVLLECTRCPAGVLLTNQTVCDIFDLIVSIRVDTRSTPLLCQYADNILTQFILIVYAHLQKEKSELSESVCEPHHPFGVLAMCRILKFLADMINPDDHRNDKEIREMGLRLVNIALETTGTRIGYWPTLLEVVQDEICKQLLQNSQTIHPFILSLTLRIFFNLFSSVKQHLKVQLEVFFTSIHLRIAESRSSGFEHKQMVLESLVEFCHEPSLIVGLYRNYDCEVSSTNLFEDLCKSLSRLALPVDDTTSDTSSLQTLALESILAILDSLAKRFGAIQGYSESEEDDTEKEQSETQKEEKEKITQAVQRFNCEGPKSFKFLQSIGILDSPLSAESISLFFRTAPMLDRYLVGAYLGMPQEFNQTVLRSYLESFDLSELRIDQALRVFLESFVLPGEAQIIERIMECFAEQYVSSNASSSLIASKDAAFVLAYSIIMLNTDAHNPQVNHKMTLESWIRNNRGINDTKDFPEQFLIDIYDSITKSAIRIQSETVADVLEDGYGVSSIAWKRLIAKSRQVGVFKTSGGLVLGKQMFFILSNSSLHMLDYFIEHTRSAKLLQLIIEGYHSFARLCSMYQLNESFNNLIIPLCKSLCNLLQLTANDTEGVSPIVSFGRNRRAQRICSLLFHLVLGHQEADLSDGWPNLIHVFLWLSQLNMLPISLTSMDDFRDRNGNLLISKAPEYFENAPQATNPKIAVKEDNSAFGLFLGLLSMDELERDLYPQENGNVSIESDEDTTASLHEDDEYFKLGKECIQSCQMESLFQSSELGDDSLRKLVETLVFVSTYSSGLLGDDLSPVATGVFAESVLNEQSAVFCIERLCQIVENNEHRLDVYWDLLKSHFDFVLCRISREPSFFVERIIVNLLRLSVFLANTCNAYLKEVFELLHRLLDIPHEALSHLSDRIAAGLQLLVQTGSKSVSQYEGWYVVFNLIQKVFVVDKSRMSAMDVMEDVVRNHIGVQNYWIGFSSVTLMIEEEGKDVDTFRLLDCLVLLYSKLKNVINKMTKQKKMANPSNMSMKELWLCSIQSFCRLTKDKRPEIRLKAVDCLFNAMISSGVSIKSPGLWKIAFENVLIPLLLDEEDEDGVEDTSLVSSLDMRIKISNVLVQVFLHNIAVLVEIQQFHLFWLTFLGSLERFMTVKSDQEQKVSQHFIESVRNALLVMKAQGIMDLVTEKTGQDILDITLNVMESFRPDVKKELENLLEN